MFKKIGIGVMLFFMAVSVPIIVPSCNSTSTPTGPGNNSTTPTVNTPTNKYFVSVIVTNLGGLGGCGMGIVKKDINNDGSFSQTINDAQITINSTNLTVDTSLGLYSTSSLSADAGTGTYPPLVFMMFQLFFAAVTITIVTSAVAERICHNAFNSGHFGTR